MKTLRAWIEAVRLRTIPVSVAGVFTAWACSFIDGNFNPIPAVLCLFFAILCQKFSSADAFILTGFQHLKLNKSSINRRNAVFICQILL